MWSEWTDGVGILPKNFCPTDLGLSAMTASPFSAQQAPSLIYNRSKASRILIFYSITDLGRIVQLRQAREEQKQVVLIVTNVSDRFCSGSSQGGGRMQPHPLIVGGTP